MKYTERLDRVFQIQKRRIIKFLSIRNRITFVHGDYTDLINHEATWFIDPPYQVMDRGNTIFQNGDGYSKKCNSANLNFNDLRKYVMDRIGQVIVCEKEGANWLPFEIFKKNKTSLNKNYNEVIFVR